MKPQITLSQFTEVLPKLILNQQDLVRRTAEIHLAANRSAPAATNLADETLLRLAERYSVKEQLIGSRRFENIDIVANGSDILARTQFFGQRAAEIFSEFYRETTTAPDHILHVSCTGYLAPSAPQILINEKFWHTNTEVTHAYHMGCYAAFPAVRMAEAFALAKNQEVDIVHTEMCGLHMDSQDHSPEQLVVQSLFADGHIKYSASSQNRGERSLAVINILGRIIPGSEADMSWIPASFGMRMTLSRDVPNTIKSVIRNFVKALVDQSGLDFATVLKSAIFAVHPGGPKIIDVVREALELSEEQVSFSKELLFSRGNMSSATLPHVWHMILNSDTKKHTPVISLAFGPGLTVFGGVFEVL